MWTCCSPPEGNFTEEHVIGADPSRIRQSALQSPGGEFHGGTSKRPAPSGCACATRCSPPEGNFTEELPRPHPRLGQGRRRCSPPEGNFTEELGIEGILSLFYGFRLQSPGGEFHGGTLARARRPTAPAQRLGLQSPGGEFHGGTAPVEPLNRLLGAPRVAVPRRGISRRNAVPERRRRRPPNAVAVPRRGISRRNPAHHDQLPRWLASSCSPPEGNFTEEQGP